MLVSSYSEKKGGMRNAFQVLFSIIVLHYANINVVWHARLYKYIKKDIASILNIARMLKPLQPTDINLQIISIRFKQSLQYYSFKM